MNLIQELNKFYLSCENSIRKEDEYIISMLVENSIPGLLPCKCGYDDTTSILKFDITNLTPLSGYYENRKMSYSVLYKLLCSIDEIVQNATSYLLEEKSFCFNPNYIYINSSDGNIYLPYLPFDNIDSQNLSGPGNRFYPFADFLIGSIDHSDRQAIQTAYNFYQMSKEPTFSFSAFCLSLESSDINTPSSSEESIISVDASSNMLTDNDNSTAINDLKTIPGNSHGFFKTWWSAILCAFLAISSFLLYYFLIDYSVYASYIFILSAILLIAGIGLSIRNIVRYFIIRQEDAIQMPDKPVTVNDFWGESEATQFFDTSSEETVFFDIDSSVTKHYISWNIDGIAHREEIVQFPCILGKKKEDVNCWINDISISRIHAKIYSYSDSLYLEDLHSTNGTFINGERIRAGTEIPFTPSDEIQFGKVPVTVV